MQQTKPTRTLGHCRRYKLSLLTYCPCAPTHRELEVGPICRAFDEHTVDELHRLGFFRCEACRAVSEAVLVMGDYWGMKTGVETWNGRGGWWRPVGSEGVRV